MFEAGYHDEYFSITYYKMYGGGLMAKAEFNFKIKLGGKAMANLKNMSKALKLCESEIKKIIEESFKPQPRKFTIEEFDKLIRHNMWKNKKQIHGYDQAMQIILHSTDEMLDKILRSRKK